MHRTGTKGAVVALQATVKPPMAAEWRRCAAGTSAAVRRFEVANAKRIEQEANAEAEAEAKAKAKAKAKAEAEAEAEAEAKTEAESVVAAAAAVAEVKTDPAAASGGAQPPLQLQPQLPPLNTMTLTQGAVGLPPPPPPPGPPPPPSSRPAPPPKASTPPPNADRNGLPDHKPESQRPDPTSEGELELLLQAIREEQEQEMASAGGGGGGGGGEAGSVDGDGGGGEEVEGEAILRDTVATMLVEMVTFVATGVEPAPSEPLRPGEYDLIVARSKEGSLLMNIRETNKPLIPGQRMRPHVLSVQVTGFRNDPRGFMGSARASGKVELNDYIKAVNGERFATRSSRPITPPSYHPSSPIFTHPHPPPAPQHRGPILS